MINLNLCVEGIKFYWNCNNSLHNFKFSSSLYTSSGKNISIAFDKFSNIHPLRDRSLLSDKINSESNISLCKNFLKYLINMSVIYFLIYSKCNFQFLIENIVIINLKYYNLDLVLGELVYLLYILWPFSQRNYFF